MLATGPAHAEAAKRPGTPKAKTVLRAIAAAGKATPFASGRAAAGRARSAFARKRYCVASDALAAHHAQVVKRVKVAKRRRQRSLARRLLRVDGRGVRARALVLRSLPLGRACGGPPAVGVDTTLKPRAQLPALDGSGARPMARMVDATGQAVDFAANELIVSGSDAEVRATVKRWGGKILATADLTVAGAEDKQFLVRIQTAKADETRLSTDLAALSRRTRGGASTVSSEAGLDLLAAAAREARSGRDVGVNYVSEGSAIASGVSREGPAGPSGFAVAGGDWDSNAFNWTYLSGAGAQGTGTAQAWQLLKRSRRDANKVGLAVLDMGFSPNVNGPDFGAPLESISNVPFKSALETPNILSCSGGAACPWHGTQVANAAFAVPDNNVGVAGSGGPVADRIVVFTLYDFFTSISALSRARIAGAKVINMSYGVGVPYYLAWSVLPFEIATSALRLSGAVLTASAGNEGKNVDDTDCFLVCWEEKWWTPCENAGVTCVGALAHNSKDRASYSNYGKAGGGVDLFAPGTILMGPDPNSGGGGPVLPIRSKNGTSFAAPYLAGVAALVWAADPSLSAGDVEKTLLDSAKTSPDKNVRKYVDADAAVRRALPRLIAIEQPVEGSAIPKGTPVTFSAFVFEDGRGSPGAITWRSADGTVIGTGTTFSTSELPYGSAEVMVAAGSGTGFVTDRVRFTVTNNPPAVDVRNPVDGASFYQNEQVAVNGESGDVNQPESGYRLRDDQVAWYRDGSATPFATGHSGTLDLTGVPVGAHTITMRGTDDAGATATSSITIDVQPASANPPPSVSITSPANGESKPASASDAGGFYALFNFQADVSDPNGDPLTYTWTETMVPSTTGVTRSTVEDPGDQKVYSHGCAEQGHDWTLSVSDGTSTRSSTVRVYLGGVVC